MRNENDLRSALRSLERETPDAEEVLSGAALGVRPGRRLLAGSAAAVAVVALAIAAALLVAPFNGRGRPTPQNSLRSVPRYYMALVPVNSKLYGHSGTPAGFKNYAAIRDTITGRTLATIKPPKPYIAFEGVYGADDDRTFMLAAGTTTGFRSAPEKFFYARFSPAGNAVTLTPLALRGLPLNNYFAGAALSPDGTRLAVQNFDGGAITVYSLRTGAARTWMDNRIFDVAEAPTDLLSWSRSGILAFGWYGSQPIGEYLLDTNSPGGNLLADSRAVICLAHSAPPSLAFRAGYFGYLTPGGKNIISPVLRPIPVGRTVPSCGGPAQPRAAHPKPARAELEEFSATTGQPVKVINTSRAHGAVADPQVYWSNASGSVLVVQGKVAHGPAARWAFGVLDGGSFTPLPGSSILMIIGLLAF